MGETRNFGGGSYYRWEIYGQSEYVLYCPSAGPYQFAVDDGSATVSVDSDVTPTTDVWYFVVAWHDSVANTINIQVNDVPYSGCRFDGGLVPGTAYFAIGFSGVTSNMDGLLDEVGFWKRTLTADERTWLYNSGNGRSYDNIVYGFNPADLLTDLISWWKLDDALDAHGSMINPCRHC